MAKHMAYGKPDVAAIILLACLLALTAIAAIGVAITGSKEAAAANFGVGITIPPLIVNQTAPIQNQTVFVNGTNISIRLPVTYRGTGLQNITMALLSSWKKVSNIKINESGVIKNVTAAGSEITWEANHSSANVTMIFDAAPPGLNKVDRFLNSTFAQTNLTIDSDNSFANASASVEVNVSYLFYSLYWSNGSNYSDKTVEFNLRIASGTATWDSFSTSTVLFRLEGTNSCTESWSCTGWSSSPSCGTRACTDANHCGTAISKPSESSTCPTTATPGGGGGGGGGGGTAKAAAKEKGAEGAPFSVDRRTIKERIRRGELKKSRFTITNTGAERLKLDITVEGKSDIISLEMSYLELEPGSSRTVGLLILSDAEMELGVYTSTISVRSGGFEKTVAVSVEVAEVKSLFDVLVAVNPRTKSLLPGDTVIAGIELFNLAGAGRFDVNLLYGVKDYNDRFIIREQQTVAVETKASVTAAMDLPVDIHPGTYSFIAYVQMNGINIGVGSDTFEVLSPPKPGNGKRENLMFYIALAALIMAVCLLILLSRLKPVSRSRQGMRKMGKEGRKSPGFSAPAGKTKVYK